MRLPSVEQFRRIDRPAADADLAEGIDQVAFAVAADAGVPRGNVGQDGDVGPALIARLADDQFVGQADPVPAHGIDPEHEPIRGFGVAESHGHESLECNGEIRTW